MIAEQELSDCTSSHQVQLKLEVVGGGQRTITQRLRKEISEYILSKNSGHCFDSALRYRANFSTHIRRLAEARQIVLYKRGDKIVGAVGWVWTNDTERLGKGMWYTPIDIVGGGILYVSFAALDKGVKLYDWIKMLRKETIKRGTKEVHWGHHKRGVFKKRRLFTMTNCGLQALSKIRDLKGVSAFTLIHLGKDNGVDLKLFKVKEKDLPLVHRPAIFHSENHFEFIENGEALPDQKWSGYVLTQKSIGIPISHKEAKEVVGGMPPLVAVVGGIASAVGGAVTATVAAVGAVGGAIGGTIGALGGTAAGTVAGASIGSGLATGALIGGAGGAALAGATGSSVGRGAIQGAAIGGGAGVGAGFGGAFGLTGTQIGASLAGAASGAATSPSGQRVTGAIKGGATGFAAGTLTDAFLKNYPGGAPGGVSGGGAGVGAGVGGGAVGAGVGGNIANAGTGASLAGSGALATGANKFDLGSIGFGDDFKSTLTAGAVGLAGAKEGPKSIDFDPTAEYTTLRNIIGTQGLPPAAEKQILNDINTPISELATQFAPVSDRTIRRINEAFDQRDTNIQRSFAQAGQNERNSSEVRGELQKSRLDRATALGEAEQEAFNAGISQAIQSKQFALNQSIQANQFDVNLALELADMIGSKKALEAAIQQDDANQFNNLLAQILNVGFGGQNTDLERIQQKYAALAGGTA